MSDNILLSASPKNIEACLALADQHNFGIEMMAFAYPNLLDGDWRSAIEQYKRWLEPVRGARAMHGPFMDMASGSPDQKINAVCAERFRHALRIGQELHVGVVVLHANFIASIHTREYRVGWQQRNIDFWGELALYAQQLGVLVAVENMWEFDPDIIGDVLKAVDHPNLRACLDVGHAHLYSNVPFTTWLTTMQPYLVHLHINNNDGVTDYHRGLHNGVLDYRALLAQVRELPSPPSITLEMDTVDDMRDSLPYLETIPTP